MSEGLYPIRAVAKLTGITADNIRAWERRYRAVVPQRSKGGRLFSEKDLARLKLLKKAVDNGHSIGRIAALNNESLAQLPLKSDVREAAAQLKRDADHREVKTVLDLIRDYEFFEATRTLGKLASFLPPREFIHQIVVPLMHQVGQAWCAGTITIAQEHMASAMVRDVMGTLIRLYHRDAPKSRLMFATPVKEHHEFGILAAALLAANAGLGVVYLGTNLPCEELTRAARKTNPRAVVLGVLHQTSREKSSKTFFRALRKDLPGRIDLMVGGQLEAAFLRDLTRMGIPVFGSLEAFETKIRQYGAVV